VSFRRVLKQRRRMMFRCFLICLLMIVSAAPATAHWACTTEEPTCKLVFIVHDSWHAAIVLRKSDIPVDSVPELLDFPEAVKSAGLPISPINVITADSLATQMSGLGVRE